MTGNQQLRNILKSINFGELTASQVNQVGSGVFADINAKTDMKNLNEITNAWRAVTNPSYGQFIPQSGEITNTSFGDSATPIVSPTGNQVFSVSQISVLNGNLSGGDVTITLTMNAASAPFLSVPVTVATATAAAGATAVFDLQYPIEVDANNILSIEATSGNMTAAVYTSKVAI